MSGIGLLSIGAYVPERKLTNLDLEKMVETTDEWIFQRTGIRERRIAGEGVNPSDMAAEAARNCLNGSDVRPDLLISSSATVERHCPYQASIVANRLKFENLAAFDINAACSGLVYAMAIASSMMQSGGFKYGLLTASEKMSAFTDYTDRASCILFGDGAAAILLASEGYEHEIVATELGCDPSGSDSVTMGARDGAHFFWQDGHQVYMFAQNTMIRMIDLLKKKAGLTDDDEFYVIPHQANLRIAQTVSEKTGIPMDRFVMNIERFGNTSSASIGLALEEAWRTDRFKKGDYVLLIGFGGGLSWAGAVIRW
jgi:3-oxoacyl-[acyl-carrier-protein] synthase III